MVSTSSALSVAQAFDTFAFRLELTDEEQSYAALRQREIEMALAPLFAIERTLFGGSFARRTIVRPVRAADLMVVLGPRECCYRMRRPSAVIRAFGNALAPSLRGLDERPGYLVIDLARGRRQPVSRIHLVPTFAQPDGWAIPDPAGNRWLLTDPDRHAQLAERSSTLMPKRWRSLVQMMKCWNSGHHPSPIQPGFLIEVIALECLAPPQGSWDYAIYGFFEVLGQRLAEPWFDPAGTGAVVRDALAGAELRRAQEVISRGQACARVAIERAGRGDIRGALEQWRQLFGDLFPVD